jgi:hypothetical protein
LAAGAPAWIGADSLIGIPTSCEMSLANSPARSFKP